MSELGEIRKEIARIVDQSCPSCGLLKECNTECGECGADYILSYLAEQGVMLRTPRGSMLLQDLLGKENNEKNSLLG